MGPIRGPLVIFPYGSLALWLGWCWRGSGWRASWWLSWGVGSLIGAVGFLVRVAVLSVLVGENLWVVITSAAAGLLEKLAGWVGLAASIDLAQVQLAAVALVWVQNGIVVLALNAVAYWIFPRLRAPNPEPPQALRAQVAAAGLEERVHFLGALPPAELKWPLSAADVFVLHATRKTGLKNGNKIGFHDLTVLCQGKRKTEHPTFRDA
jgi:hypothetical protein